MNTSSAVPRERRGLTSRTLFGLLAVVASATIVACTASGRAEGRGKLNTAFVPAIEWGVDITLGEFEVDGGEPHANKCVQVTWTGADGAEISTETLATDGSGKASGQVPTGAVRWEAKLVDCPEPEPDDGGGGMYDPVAQGPQQGGQQGQRGSATPLPTREFIIFGSPILPSDVIGTSNLTYAFAVKATSFAQAGSIVAPIIAGGIGTPVPTSVKVLTFSTLTSELFGGRLVTALPGKFTGFSFDFNHGAFTADVVTGHNTLNYELNGWDVIEVAIPLSAFDYGVSPGVVYSNDGDAVYTSDQWVGPCAVEYGFDFEN